MRSQKGEIGLTVAFFLIAASLVSTVAVNTIKNFDTRKHAAEPAISARAQVKMTFYDSTPNLGTFVSVSWGYQSSTYPLKEDSIDSLGIRPYMKMSRVMRTQLDAAGNPVSAPQRVSFSGWESAEKIEDAFRAQDSSVVSGGRYNYQICFLPTGSPEVCSSQALVDSANSLYNPRVIYVNFTVYKISPTPTITPTPNSLAGLQIEAEAVVGMSSPSVTRSPDNKWLKSCRIGLVIPGNNDCLIRNETSFAYSSFSFTYYCPQTHNLDAIISKYHNLGKFSVTSSSGISNTIDEYERWPNPMGQLPIYPRITLLSGLSAGTTTITVKHVTGNILIDKFFIPSNCQYPPGPTFTPTVTPTGGVPTLTPTRTPTPTASKTPTPTPTSSSSLVLKLNMNEGSGSTTADASGNNYNGNLTGNYSWSADCRSGNCLTFNGESPNCGYINLGDTSTHPRLNLNNGPFTIALWIKRTNPDSGYPHSLIAKKDIGYAYELYNNAQAAAVGNENWIFDNNPIANTWEHVAISYNKSTNTAQFYYNGVAATTANPSWNFNSVNGNVYVGAREDPVSPPNPYYCFTGSMDELVAYDQVLSPQEVCLLAGKTWNGTCQSVPTTPTPTKTSTPTPTKTPTPTITPTPALACTYQFMYKFPHPTAGAGGFQGIAIDPSDNVYAAASDNMIYKFYRDGTLLTGWGGTGTGDSQLKGPFGIAYNSANGYLYVADRQNKRVQVFNTVGTPITRWSLTDMVFGIAVNPVNNHIYVSENYAANPKDVKEFTTSGTLVNTYTGEYGFNPNGLISDASGNIFVMNGDIWNTRSVDRLTMGDTAFRKFITQDCSSPPGNFNYISFIGIDSQKNLYVPEYYSAGATQVNKYNSTGQCITKIGSRGSADDQFYNPYGVAVDSRGYLFVVDSGYIKVFACLSGTSGLGAMKTVMGAPASPTPTRTPTPAIGLGTRQSLSPTPTSARISIKVQSYRNIFFSYKAKFTWNTISNASKLLSGYHIYQSTAGRSFTRVYDTANTSAKSKEITISKNTSYSFKFCAVLKNGKEKCGSQVTLKGGVNSTRSVSIGI